MKAIKNSALGLFGITGVLVSIFGIKIPFAESFAKEHWRAGLAALLLIILMIPAAIGLFLYLVDANRFKTEIVQYVKAHSQRDLVLQGDLKLTFFPKLGLDSGKMSLSERNSAREFASINNARLYIAWWPLLKKQLVLERVEIDGIRANLTRFKDGTTNFDDLLVRNEVLSPVTFDIEGLRVTNSAINWQDEMKWQRVAVQDIRIETGRLADTVPGNLKASFHLNSERLHSDSNIELKSSLFFDRKAMRYEFADIDGKLDGTAGGFSNLDLSFKGSLDSNPAQQSLLAENIVVSGTGNYGQRSIEARLGMPKLQYAKDTLSGSNITLDATLAQFDEKWTASLQMPAFDFSNKIFKAGVFSTDFDFSGPGRRLQGKLSSPASMDFEAAPTLLLGAMSLDFSAKDTMLSGELSGKATGKLSVDLSGRSANLGFKATVDDSDITGKMALADFNHPAYMLDININRIDLDRYIAADWIKRYQNDATHLDLGGLKDMNLSGSLHAGEIRVAKLKASKLTAVIKIEQSELAIAPLSARLYGGILNGSFSADARGKPQFTLAQNLRGVQMNSLLADTAAIGKLDGKGDIALNISAEGGSIGELRKTLDGSLALALGRGSIAGIDLRTALVEGRDDLGTRSEPRVHESRFSERTGFSGLKAAFNIKDGISHGNSFELRSALYRVAGEGDITPGSGSINFQLAAVVAPALKRHSAGDLAELRGVTIPVRVSGRYVAPAITLDFAAASGDIVTKRISAARAAAEHTPVAKQAPATKKRAKKPAKK
ncbi:MAG: AsmA family protein [Candidatus Gallionella acididurans]|uniref:AsmA family protein n=1 Tax=Candidatus Gallionella acididurans TaxID=1796491 RepID=A0A139BY39_9PROT|nr:MAG: AsmA family protein [Candidatus Gallionella acididurans]